MTCVCGTPKACSRNHATSRATLWIYRINLKGVVIRKNWRNLEGREGRSSKKPDEVKEVGGMMCKMISPHEARELPASQCYLLTSPHLYTSNNHASALLHVFLSSYIIEHRCLVLLLPWSCWKFFFYKNGEHSYTSSFIFWFSVAKPCNMTSGRM